MTNSQQNAVKLTNLVRQSASPEYQNAVPELAADGSNLGVVGRAINEYTQNKNEFISVLINRIGLTMVMSADFTDPFYRLDKERLTKGDTVQDIYVDPKPGTDYAGIPADGGTVDPYIVSRPIVNTDYNSKIIRRTWINTISEEMLRQAFIDVNKLDEFMRKAIDSAFVSLQMERWARTKTALADSTIYTKPNQTITLTGTGSDLYKDALLQIKNAKSKISYPSRLYNTAGVLTRTPSERAWLVVTSEFYNAIGVDVLSGVFNLRQAETDFSNVIEVDNFEFKELGLNLPETPKENLVAVVFDGFYMKNHDMIDAMFKAIENPRGLYWNYYLHWWALRYFSPFGNIIGIVKPTPAA